MMKNIQKSVSKHILVFLWIWVSCIGIFAQSGLSLPPLFSDNMVLQRQVNPTIWGTGEPGNIVKIKINKLSVETIVNKDGKWMAELPAQPAGGPYELVVTSQSNKIAYKNVMIGDVWVASGQSNMAMSVKNSANYEEEKAAANHPNIRFFSVKRSVSSIPVENLEDGKWYECSPESVGYFSAVGYYFGRDIHQEMNVPVGIIKSSWGGTKGEAWTSFEMLKTMKDYKDVVSEIENTTADYQKLQKLSNDDGKYNSKLIKESQEGINQKVHSLKYDDSAWETMELPKFWEGTPLNQYVGFVWFRVSVTIPKKNKKDDFLLSLGKITYEDKAYFNGVEIGKSNLPHIHREYKIPKKLVKAGENVIAVRILNRWGNGGFKGPEDEFFIQSETNPEVKIPLNITWKYNEKIEPAFKKVIGYQDKPGSLYNAMIAPIINYDIKGAIWYQGEANVERAHQYRELLPKMIQDWRIHWKQGYFPFLIVQLANYGDIPKKPNDDEWAELREAQLLTAQNHPNVGLAVTIDIGNPMDIHPKNKQEVGRRLSLAAQKIAYGKDIVYSGPTYQSMETKGNTIELSFDNIGSGLISKNNKPLKGFAIAGDDMIFYWANAKIEGEKIIVSSKEVTSPKAVRYAWDDSPECNLYNKEGLPASPFRTDKQKCITFGVK